MKNYLYIFVLCTNIKQKDYALFFLERVKNQRTIHQKKSNKTPQNKPLNTNFPGLNL